MVRAIYEARRSADRFCQFRTLAYFNILLRPLSSPANAKPAFSRTCREARFSRMTNARTVVPSGTIRAQTARSASLANPFPQNSGLTKNATSSPENSMAPTRWPWSRIRSAKSGSPLVRRSGSALGASRRSAAGQSVSATRGSNDRSLSSSSSTGVDGAIASRAVSIIPWWLPRTQRLSS
jgi:hypothetical protein